VMCFWRQFHDAVIGPTIYLSLSVRYAVAPDVQQLKVLATDVPRLSVVPNYTAIRNT